MTCSVHSDFGNYAKPVLPKPVPAVDRTCISPVFAGGAVAQDSSRGLGATTRLVRSEFHNVTLFGRYPFFKNVVICFDDLGLSSTLRGTVYGSVSRGDLFSPPNQVISNRGNQLGEDPCTVDGRPPIARLYLLGPVRLTDQDGFDRTPKGGVRRALLAVLALSQHGTKSRLSLQDMFWGDRDPVRGASSLRNALSVLKKDLAELGDELITSDAQDVRLNMDRLWVDVAHYASENGGALLRQTHGQRLPDLIEGLNVRATGDDTFEDWLRVERQHWIDVLEPRLAPPVERERIDPPLRDPARTALPDLQSHFGIGLLPTISRANALHAGLFGDSIMDSIADNLRSLHLAEIYDYRADNSARFDIGQGNGPSILLQLKLFQDANRINMTLLVYRTSQQRLLWTWPMARRLLRRSGLWCWCRCGNAVADAGCGIASRLLSGWLADRIGGVPTLLIGSVLQGLALFLYIPFNGLASLYIVSLIFGLSQGGIVPSYAMIVREYLPAEEAGKRIGFVMVATVAGMAVGGWASGFIFDLTGSYRMAFIHGIAWNIVNMAIMVFILLQSRPAKPQRASSGGLAASAG